jgi:hypothetical protein
MPEITLVAFLNTFSRLQSTPTLSHSSGECKYVYFWSSDSSTSNAFLNFRAILSIKYVEFQRVITSSDGFLLHVMPSRATISLNICFLEVEERRYLMISQMLSTTGLTDLSPSFTIRFMTCPAHRW